MSDDDFFQLSRDNMQEYSKKMILVFSVLNSVYQKLADTDQTIESQVVCSVLQRLLYTKQTLFFQYLFSEETPRIDGIDSGFFDSYLLQKLEGMSIHAEQELAKLPSKISLLNRFANDLFGHQSINTDSQSLLAKHELYSRLLQKQEQFFGFLMGEITLLEEQTSDGMYRYTIWWACFDRQLNKPFIYFMDFHSQYNLDEDENREVYERLLKVIKQEGYTSAQLSTIGVNIDAMLDDVHPKMLKRVGITLYSQLFSKELPDFCTQLFPFGETGEQFCLLIENELLISKQQIESGKFFQKQKREVFYIPPSINEQSQQGVSHVDKWLIMPYRLHQHTQNIVPKGFTIYSFDNKGGVHDSTH